MICSAFPGVRTVFSGSMKFEIAPNYCTLCRKTKFALEVPINDTNICGPEKFQPVISIPICRIKYV